MSVKYLLLDSGDQKKLEQFGPYRVIRPCSQALWSPSLKKEEWNRADSSFDRDNGWKKALPESWVIEFDGLQFKISPTDFGHMGIFPEHALLWNWGADLVGEGDQVLNLFAYSGGATLGFARSKAKVCHLDASKPMVSWARENAQLNDMHSHPIRWIIDDVHKFLQREIRRENKYQGILLDPPSFGRGTRKEVFKIERDILPLLRTCKKLLADDARFFAFSTHTPGMTPQVMEHLLEEVMQAPVESGEMILPSKMGRDLPAGSFARWKR